MLILGVWDFSNIQVGNRPTAYFFGKASGDWQEQIIFDWPNNIPLDISIAGEIVYTLPNGAAGIDILADRNDTPYIPSFEHPWGRITIPVIKWAKASEEEKKAATDNYWKLMEG